MYYSYNQFIDDLKLLIDNIDVEFDAIVPIARGGLGIGLMLAEHYNIRDIYTINTIGYNGTFKLDTIRVFNIPDLSSISSILIVDDIVDSGDTLIEVIQNIKEKYPKLRVYTASIFYKRSAKIRPNWFINYADEWIDFFWERDLRNY